MNVGANGRVNFKIKAAEVIFFFISQDTGQIFLDPETKQSIIRNHRIIAVFHRISSRKSHAAPRLPGIRQELNMRLEYWKPFHTGNETEIPEGPRDLEDIEGRN